MIMRQAKWKLACLWFFGSGAIFVLLVIRSMTNVYQPRTEDAWSWFLPTIMPTLSLIIASLISEETRTKNPAESSQKPLRKLGLFRLALGMSALYLLLVATAILAPAYQPNQSALELMNLANLWLGPLQGLTAAMLGFFYQTSQNR